MPDNIITEAAKHCADGLGCRGCPYENMLPEDCREFFANFIKAGTLENENETVNISDLPEYEVKVNGIEALEAIKKALIAWLRDIEIMSVSAGLTDCSIRFEFDDKAYDITFEGG